MNLLERLKYTFKEDLGLTQTEENPVTRLNQYVHDAEAQTNEAKSLLMRHRQLKQMIEEQLVQATTLLEKRQQQCALAEQTGEEDLITFAHAETTVYTNRVTMLQQSVEEAATTIIRLEQKYEAMKHKIEEMKIRQLQLMGYENNIRAERQMDAMLHPENNQNISTKEEMEQYLDLLQTPTEKPIEASSSLEERLIALEGTRLAKTK